MSANIDLIKRKNKILINKNTSLTAEVKRLTDELNREKFKRNEEFLARTKLRIANHNKITSLKAEVKRLKDELNRAKLYRNDKFLARKKSEIAKENFEELYKKSKAEKEALTADLQAKVQNLHDKNTRLTAEVKRITDELNREKLYRNDEFLARTKSEIAKKNFEELFKKYKAENECLRADLHAKISKNDYNEIKLQIKFLGFKMFSDLKKFMIRKVFRVKYFYGTLT